MGKISAIIMALMLLLSFTHSWDEGSASSPSPGGDTRMGADAAASGTDVTDKEVQAQQDKRQLNQDQEELKKKNMNDEDRPQQNLK